MNQLPHYRQIIHGRTHARSWSACEMDPIDRPDRMQRLHDVARHAERAMLVVAGVFIALLCKGVV